MNKKVIVIGGSTGIGHAVTDLLLSKDYDVVVSSRCEDNFKNLIQNFSIASGLRENQLSYMHVDASQEKSVIELASRVKNDCGNNLWGLVCCNGLHLKKNILDTTFNEWKEILDVNLNATFLLNKYISPILIENGGGSIVNIGSLGSWVALSKASAYCVSKSGVEMLTKCMASELADKGIRVNAVLPGVVETELNRKALSDKKRRQDILKNTPMARFGLAREIASAVSYLLDKDSSYTTGASIPVDGGFLSYSGY